MLNAFATRPAEETLLLKRGYLIMICTLCAWCVAAAMILVEMSSWPYLGADFASNGRAAPTIVEHVRANGPAAAAGLRVGDEIVALGKIAGPRYAMTGLEAIPGREMLHSYQDANDARTAKSRSWQIIEGGQFFLELASGERRVVSPADGRPALSVPLQAYVYLLQSLIIVSIASGILSFAPTTLPVLLLGVTGLAMSVNMMLNALTATAEMTMPSGLWAFYDHAVPTALVIFCYGLVALLWYFPSPISAFPFGPLMVAVAAIVVFGQSTQLFSFPLHPYQGPYVSALIPAMIIASLSWRRTRNEPLKRASVMWFVLSIMIVSVFAFLFYTLPVIMGHPPLASTALTLFAITLIYIGLALGTLRYRLFDIRRIWWRTITWMVSGLLVVVVDILLIAIFGLGQAAALPVAMLITGWVYFPLRQFVIEHFVNPREVRTKDHIPALIQIFSQLEDLEAFDGRFAHFLQGIFAAEDLTRPDMALTDKAHIADNGLALRVPVVSGRGVVELTGKQYGRQLFSPSDAQVGNAMVDLVRYMARAREFEAEKVQQERQRILRDLHDDVGGRLLSIVYNSQEKSISETARETLAALKDSLFVIEDTQMVDVTTAWNKWRSDGEARLTSAGFSLKVKETFESERILSAREYINLKRCLQEIVSNIMKYGAKNDVEVSIVVDETGLVRLRVTNTVGGGPSVPSAGGRGLPNIRTRMQEVRGSVEVDHSIQNCGQALFSVEISLPFEG